MVFAEKENKRKRRRQVKIRIIRSESFRKGDFHYFKLNKPYGVLCQFSDPLGRRTLADLGKFPRDVYPVGRLDLESEGLVLLTNDGKLKEFLLNPDNMHPRTYLVQVENLPNRPALEKLRCGINLKDYKTRPVDAEVIKNPPIVPDRSVPVRYRKNIPTAWLRLTLHEGKNRQVRRMTAAVGHPTLRLIRISIGSLKLSDLRPGEVRELSKKEIQELKTEYNFKLNNIR
jgi:23S rRNA pseudouridine2457 synthase